MARTPLSNLAPLDRFNAFSDGVLAIIITILVLELPVPEHWDSLGADLLAESAAFIGYFVSFAIIGASWMEHSRLHRTLRRRGTLLCAGVAAPRFADYCVPG